ncbi:glycosyltransferase [Wenzhouxiangella sp. XN24]|nr:glycosyltransferase [Wenzhouxiangella sp. XN24]
MRQIGLRHEMRVVAFQQAAHQSTSEEKEAAVEALSEFGTFDAVHPLPQDVMKGGQYRLALRSLLPGIPYTIRWGRSSAFGASVRNSVSTFRPELIHFDTISLAPYWQLAGRVPKILNHHNIESQMLKRRAMQESNLAKRAYFRQEAFRLQQYERKVADSFAAHLTCSELDAERLEEVAGPLNIRIVPNGVDLDYFQPNGNAQMRPNSLVFVGGLSWYPNASAVRGFLQEVWPVLTAARPDVRLTVVGAGVPPDMRRFSESDNRVKFPGFVDDIRPIVQESQAYICPIRDGGGTKLKMLDAMAMGKAIVAHPVACEGLSLTNELNVLHATSAGSFVSQICRVFDSDSLRAKLQENARAHVERHFCFNSIGDALADYYTGFL